MVENTAIYQCIDTKGDVHIVLTGSLTQLHPFPGSGVEHMDLVGKQWDQFDVMLDSHQDMIKAEVPFFHILLPSNKE